MQKRRQRQIRLAQNFLRNPGLVRRLLAKSTIGPDDIVYEIGPGGGIITNELARLAKKVVAIEKDRALARRLEERYRLAANVEIVAGDFLHYRIEDREYKIFASIPYNLTARIMRRLIHSRPAPRDAFLIMQKEAAKKFAGRPRETLFSLLAKPFFDLRIVYQLKRTDFQPVPYVDSVMLHICRCHEPLIANSDVDLYRDFVRFVFRQWKPHLRSAFKNVFSYNEWKRMSRELDFSLDATPTELSFTQWLGLFERLKAKRAGDRR